jgi:hypothetical protein
LTFDPHWEARPIEGRASVFEGKEHAMRIHRCLVPLLIVMVAAAVDGAKAVEPAPAPLPKTRIVSPNAAIEAKNGSVPQGNGSELHGPYNFLLEVGGITPAEPSRDRKRWTGPSRSHDPRAAGQAIDSAE